MAVPKPIFDAVLRPAVGRILRLAFDRTGYEIDIGGHSAFRLSPWKTSGIAIIAVLPGA